MALRLSEGLGISVLRLTTKLYFVGELFCFSRSATARAVAVLRVCGTGHELGIGIRAFNHWLRKWIHGQVLPPVLAMTSIR